MKRDIRVSEKALLFGYSFILLFMLVQDWVPLGPLNDLEAIAAENSTSELIVVTLIGVVQILILMGLLLLFVGKRYPIWAKLWLIIHPSCIFAGALMSWWVPYFFGIGAEERAERYDTMFGDTHSFLPIMNGIAPNTLHSLFHAVLLICIILTIYISVTDRKKRDMVFENKKASIN
ncbi:hypothetical protein CWR48_18620 [Oceanobacillus arenosus]|uniref:Uncharacterized protein n=1 Tax=Oceanobacillus arenosus TaxID=1229153 RepID=A0A3D8PKJ9_9BACI|nr:hypothetical protein [Oceanobacillus arenosus]RDW15751.1 hypothetical protein CWR48_18620 [Oceanobacillus arenosus]